MGGHQLHPGTCGVRRVAHRGAIDIDACDMADFRTQKHTKLPIIVKGVQSLEDVVQCVENGVEGVILVRG
jgi:hypothetical protein